MFSPNDTTWRILGKPSSTQDKGDEEDDDVDDDYNDHDEHGDDNGNDDDGDQDEDGNEEEVEEHNRGVPTPFWDEEYSFLVEWKRELVAIFKQDEARPKTGARWHGRSWTKDGATTRCSSGTGRRGAVAVARHDGPRDPRVYLPAFAKTDGAISFYSVREGEYHPGFYDVKDQMNATW